MTETRTHRAIQFPKPDRLTEAEQIRFAEELQKVGYEPSLLELIGDWFGTERGHGAIYGFVVGAFFTVITSIIFAVIL